MSSAQNAIYGIICVADETHNDREKRNNDIDKWKKNKKFLIKIVFTIDCNGISIDIYYSLRSIYLVFTIELY